MKIEKTVKITIDEKEYEFPYGSVLSSILDSFGEKEIPVVAAFVNGYVRGLYYTIIIDCKIEWIDLTTNLGRSIYRNGLRLMLVAAHNNVLPDRTLFIKHTLGDGSYCESRGRKNFTEEMRLALKDEMQRLIDEKVPIEHRTIFREDAKILCRKAPNALEVQQALSNRLTEEITAHAREELDEDLIHTAARLEMYAGGVHDGVRTDLGDVTSHDRQCHGISPPFSLFYLIFMPFRSINKAPFPLIK